MSKGFASLAIAAMIMRGGIAVLVDLTGTPTLKPAAPLSPDPAPIRKYDVVAEYPHDPEALTQGLVYAGGFFYESIGLQGQSSIRKVEVKTGRVIQQHAVDSRCLGEGLTEWHGQLIQLTPLRTRQNAIRSLILDNLTRAGAPVGRLSGCYSGVRTTSIHSNQSLLLNTTEMDGDSRMTTISSLRVTAHRFCGS
jgi:hypothetical protein